MTVSVVILAAGQGKRLNSTKPKVLHEIGGKPLIKWVLESARTIAADNIHVVCGHGAKRVKEAVGSESIVFHEQAQRLGTGHAVMCADPALDADKVIVLYGDMPLLSVATLNRLLEDADKGDLVILTVLLDNPYGYGRIIRNAENAITQIVEQNDATHAEAKIKEVNTGVVVAKGTILRSLLKQLNNKNAQQEYYLTDCVSLAVQQGLVVYTQSTTDLDEACGVNTTTELEHAERYLQRRLVTDLMEQGCTVRDMTRLDIRGEVSVGQNVEIDVNVVLSGRIELADDVYIGPNCVLHDVILGAGTVVQSFSTIESSQLGKQCRIGPYARIRPQSEFADEVHIGNFVEVKKSTIGKGSKVNHLSYIGDSTVGSVVNIGAGTITCNYDGKDKHRTIIGDDVFIGSGTELVAPVMVADGATIGAGSTITTNAEADALTLSRNTQKTIRQWKRPRKPSSKATEK